MAFSLGHAVTAITASILVLISAPSCTRPSQPDHSQIFAHQTRAMLPPQSNLRDAAWTLRDNRVLAIGGHEAMGSSGVRSVRFIDFPAGDGQGEWRRAHVTLPRDVLAETAVSTAEGIFLFGENSATSAPLSLLRLQAAGKDDYQVSELPLLPTGLSVTAAATLGGTLYVTANVRQTRAASPGIAGAQPQSPAQDTTRLSSSPNPALDRLLSLPLAAGPSRTWNDLGSVEISLGPVTSLAAQSNGERSHLFVSGKTGLAIYEPQRREWKRIEAEGYAGAPALQVPVGIAHLYAFYPAREGEESASLRILNTVTRRWTKPFLLPGAGTPAAATASGTRLRTLLIPSGTTPQLVESIYTVRTEGLAGADYAVIALFAIGLVTMGVINSTRFRSAESYFRGGKKIPWLAAGLSVVATGQSATSFISIPGRTFATNWQFALVPLTNVFGALIMSRYFVRFFVRLNITSGYEYLQVRFSSFVRTLGSINYLAYELTRISLLILVPAVAVSSVTKIDLSLAIVIMGSVATLYTTLGGLEGVVWADVVQIGVKISAILVAVVFIFASLRGNLFELAASAWHDGKLRAVDWSFDLTRDTIWAMVLFWLTDGLKSYVANQTVIQRFISTRDLKAAQRSIRASAIVGTLIFWTFMLAGTGLFLFYRQNPERLDLTMDKPDAVFPWFIVFELPAGVAGFLITALIAAALSSLYGALNSTSTVIVTDFYRRFSANDTDAFALILGRRLTVVMGTIATGLALLLAGLASRSLVEQTLSVIGLFGGGLGGLFLVGMLTTRVSARAALIGFVVSATTQYIVSRHTPLHWLTYMFTGMGSCFVASYLASFVWPENKDLKGLTVHT